MFAGGVGAAGLLALHAINDPIAVAIAAKSIARFICLDPHLSLITAHGEGDPK
jgi:hypothetical protein